MRFRALAELFDELEKVTSGNAIRRILSAFLKTVPKEDLETAAYLVLGQTGPEYGRSELGLAEKLMIRALARASGRPAAEIARAARETGDLGSAAAKVLRGGGRLGVREVLETLRKIGATSGGGSQEKKLGLMTSLLSKASPSEAKSIVRIALGNLRMGVASATVLDSLALAFRGRKEKADLEAAYQRTSDIGLVARLAASKKRVSVGATVGVPVKMMLAQRVRDFDEIRARLAGPITAEEKYDGERVQIHKDGPKVVFFSRRLENITGQYPDVLAALGPALKARECIIEGEIVAVDKRGRLLPFQLLMQRRRKHRTEEYSRRIPVAVFLFDILRLNGRSFLEVAYPRRRSELEKVIRPSAVIRLARQVTSSDPAVLQRFFKECLARGAEGIIAKSTAPDSFYRAGTRGWTWIKWKKEYAAGERDTFDLVVVGAFHGRGRRSGAYGSLLCALYDRRRDRFVTFTKLGAGFTDAQLAGFPKILKPYATDRPPERVEISKPMTPDLYFKPGIVVEVLGANITRSPVHTSGYALRFPRLLRIRDDKGPEQATTTAEIKSF